MKAMVFAAGEGTRLRPLTLNRPKALVEVAGKPMLARVLESLRNANVTHVVVNVHYLSQHIIQYLNNNDFGMRIDIADESACLLETGGGLLAAKHLLNGNEPIILHNADICTDLDLSNLTLRGDATLLVSNRQSSRQLTFNSDMRLHGWRNLSTGEYKGNPSGLQRAFQGIHVVSPSIFPALEQYSKSINNPVFSLTPFYVAQAANLHIYGAEFDGYQWHDIGNLQKLEAANAAFQS